MTELELKIPLKCLSVVIPVFNEERTLEKITEKLMAIPQLLEIIIVDDCSTDRTAEIAGKLTARYEDIVKYVKQPRNQGKTAARHSKAATSHRKGEKTANKFETAETKGKPLRVRI